MTVSSTSSPNKKFLILSAFRPTPIAPSAAKIGPPGNNDNPGIKPTLEIKFHNAAPEIPPSNQAGRFFMRAVLIFLEMNPESSSPSTPKIACLIRSDDEIIPVILPKIPPIIGPIPIGSNPILPSNAPIPNPIPARGKNFLTQSCVSRLINPPIRFPSSPISPNRYDLNFSEPEISPPRPPSNAPMKGPPGSQRLVKKPNPAVPIAPIPAPRIASGYASLTVSDTILNFFLESVSSSGSPNSHSLNLLKPFLNEFINPVPVCTTASPMIGLVPSSLFEPYTGTCFFPYANSSQKFHILFFIEPKDDLVSEVRSL